MEETMWDKNVETVSYDEVVERIHRPLFPAMLRRLFTTSSFYKSKLGRAGWKLQDLATESALAELPMTEKAEIVDDQAADPPFGSLLATPAEQIRRVHRTSGYSGSPVYVGYTEKDVRTTLIAGARSFWCAGVRPSDVVIHCLNYCLWTGGLTDHQCLEQTGACVIPYGVGNSRNLLQVIRETRANAISCTPSYLPKLETILVNEFGEKPDSLGLKKGLFGGEAGLQVPSVRKRIEDSWGIQAVDANYGVSDVLSVFGSECRVRDGLHFHGQGILHVELIEPASRKVLRIEKGAVGEFVYSTLVKEGQPLLRFRSHDVVEIVDTAPCDCGRWGFRFRVLGRSDDMLVVKGINVFPQAIAGIVSGFRDVLTGEYQVVVDTPPPHDDLLVEIEQLPGVAPSTLDEIRVRLVRSIRARLDFTARVRFVPQGSIIRRGDKTERIRREYSGD